MVTIALRSSVIQRRVIGSPACAAAATGKPAGTWRSLVVPFIHAFKAASVALQPLL